MDDGRLTDGQGRTVSFTNTVLIMTSNVGSDRIVGEAVDEKIREQIEEVLAATFKPEFLNRIDDTVIFHRLSKADIGRIVELQVAQLVGRVRERGIEIELSDEARTLLGNLGYDPTYGARPLKRVIQKQLVDKLALKILEGEFSEGDTVRVDAAVRAVSDAVRRARAGLQDPNRPIGSFLFLGPTGVGKTELAKALAEFMFDSEQAIVRLDMSEYMEKHTVARLIGAPPGYVGYEEGGQLTEAVRRRPYAVVLLDEIEKAHPDVFNALLQLMDDGRLTDGQGRTVSFTNTVLIMTSNVGSAEIAGEAVDEAMRERIEEILATTFKPEFLNRIDDTVIFHRLGRDDLRRIVELQVGQLVGRVRERGIEVELTDDARTLLANLGYDPTYGARPLKRVIQKQLVDRLALKILEGDFAEGDTVLVDAADGELTFARAETGAPEAAETAAA
jgi:ATP-dependent Clp protease ATP-binding subunit ClpA